MANVVIDHCASERNGATQTSGAFQRIQMSLVVSEVGTSRYARCGGRSGSRGSSGKSGRPGWRPARQRAGRGRREGRVEVMGEVAGALVVAEVSSVAGDVALAEGVPAEQVVDPRLRSREEPSLASHLVRRAEDDEVVQDPAVGAPAPWAVRGVRLAPRLKPLALDNPSGGSMVRALLRRRSRCLLSSSVLGRLSVLRDGERERVRPLGQRDVFRDALGTPAAAWPAARSAAVTHRAWNHRRHQCRTPIQRVDLQSLHAVTTKRSTARTAAPATSRVRDYTRTPANGRP